MNAGIPGVAPKPSAHFNPVDFPRIIYSADGPPQETSERRYATYNAFAYREAVKAAGGNPNEFAKIQAEQTALRDSLVQEHGQEEGLAMFRAQISDNLKAQDALRRLFPTSADLDQTTQAAYIVWGALISEDAGRHGGRYKITVEEVEMAMSSPESQTELFRAAFDSLTRYLMGKGLDDLKELGQQALGSDGSTPPADDLTINVGEAPFIEAPEVSAGTPDRPGVQVRPTVPPGPVSEAGTAG
jgi:hypothetical protein